MKTYLVTVLAVVDGILERGGDANRAKISTEFDSYDSEFMKQVSKEILGVEDYSFSTSGILATGGVQIVVFKWAKMDESIVVAIEEQR